MPVGVRRGRVRAVHRKGFGMTRVLGCVVAAGLALGCAGVKPTAATGQGGSAGNPFAGAGGSAPPITAPPPPSCAPCTDFPAAPVIDGTAPASAPQTFGAPTSGSATGGPCLVEPEIGAMFPSNWLRPRFRVKAPAGQDVFEVRLHVANQTNDLVVYT